MVNSAIIYYFFNHSRKLFSFQIVALTLIACSIFFSPALSPQTKILRFSPARLVTHSVSISLAKLSRSSLRSFVKPVKQICNLSGCRFLGYDGSKGGKYLGAAVGVGKELDFHGDVVSGSLQREMGNSSPVLYHSI